MQTMIVRLVSYFIPPYIPCYTRSHRGGERLFSLLFPIIRSFLYYQQSITCFDAVGQQPRPARTGRSQKSDETNFCVAARPEKEEIEKRETKARTNRDGAKKRVAVGQCGRDQENTSATGSQKGDLFGVK